jgi:MFS family permease
MSLTPLQIQRGMRLSIIDGVQTQAFYGLTWPGSVFVTGLALLLGASNFQVGLLAAISPLLSSLNLVAAQQLEKLGTRRRYFAINAFIHRIVFLLLLALPFMPGLVPANAQIGLLIGVVLVSVIFGTLMHTTWMSWMADMVPEEKRASFFSRRNMVCTVVWMAQSYFIGKVLAAHNTVLAYSLVFGVGTIIALTSIPVVVAQPDPPIAVSGGRRSLGAMWRHAWAMPNFRNFLFFALLWGFTTNLAGPFYNVYMLKDLHVDVGQITVWGILWGVVSTITLPYWGMLGDRVGNRTTLLFALAGTCLNAFGWLATTPDNAHWLVPLLFCLGGFFDTGAGLIGFNMIFGILPDKNKPSYVGIYESIVGTTVGIAPLVGGYLATQFVKVEIPGFPVSAVYLLIAVSTVLRIFPLAFISRMPMQRGMGMGFVMREFVFTNPFRLLPSLRYDRRTPTQKITAIGTLSDMKSKAALPDLVRSMHDLNPRVRQKAVQALGAIGAPAAQEPLVQALDDPLEDIRGEAALALGKLGLLSAVPHLLAKLDSSDDHLRRCAATALGDLRAKDAVEPLINLMQTTQNNSVLLACGDALGRIGEYVCVEPLLSITRLAANKAVKHSLVACVGLLVDRGGDLYRALSEPLAHADRAAHEILSVHTVRMARKRESALRQNLGLAHEAFAKGNYNDAILEMKVVNQVSVRDYLVDRRVKDALGFDTWVKLLDSDYGTQLDAVSHIHPPSGIGLAIVDYYARHCPSPTEPDMDIQEFLLALYAFRTAQVGLDELQFGRNVLLDQVKERLGNLSDLLNVY